MPTFAASLFLVLLMAIVGSPSYAQSHRENNKAFNNMAGNFMLGEKDRVQLGECVDNMIAGNEIVRVTIEGYEFACDYARTQGHGNVPNDYYGFNRFGSDFNARLSFLAKDGIHSNRRIEIKFAANGNVTKASLFREFPLEKHETRLAVKFPENILSPSQWYADRAIENSCAFRQDSWQETANLITATLAIRLSQSFKYAMKAREDTEPLRHFQDLDGQPLVRTGKKSPILWAVRLKGKSLSSRKQLPQTTRQQCEAFCKNSRCVGWSFRPSEISASGRPITARCTIFDTVDSLTPDNKFISALKPGAFVRPVRADKPLSNICGYLHKDPDGKITTVHTLCRSKRNPFLRSRTASDSCSPLHNTCRKYEPTHEIQMVGKDCPQASKGK